MEGSLAPKIIIKYFVFGSSLEKEIEFLELANHF